MSLKDKIRKAAITGIAGLGLLVTSACTPTQYGRAVMRKSGEVAVYTAIQSGIEGQLNPNAYPTNVTVITGENQQDNTIKWGSGVVIDARNKVNSSGQYAQNQEGIIVNRELQDAYPILTPEQIKVLFRVKGEYPVLSDADIILGVLELTSEQRKEAEKYYKR